MQPRQPNIKAFKRKKKPKIIRWKISLSVTVHYTFLKTTLDPARAGCEEMRKGGDRFVHAVTILYYSCSALPRGTKRLHVMIMLQRRIGLLLGLVF